MKSKLAMWCICLVTLLTLSQTNSEPVEKTLTFEDRQAKVKTEVQKVFQDFLGKAQAGDATSQIIVADIFDQGYMAVYDPSLHINRELAWYWYEKAAAQDQAEAWYWLGMQYAEGKDVSQDNTKAVQYALKAANQNFPPAMKALVFAYLEGIGTTKNIAIGEKWLEKYLRTEAEYDDKQRYYVMGEFFAEVDTPYYDMKLAKKWYEKAAQLGSADAQSWLGDCYLDCQNSDAKKAFYWYEKAANQNLAHAQFKLDSLYFTGNGVKQDDGKAFEWYSKSAAQGNADAETNLGLLYSRGDGVLQDHYIAKQWYEKAAKQGHCGAMFQLGWAYQEGLGVKKDEAMAIKWYLEAAKQNHAESIGQIAYLYFEGKGGVVDENKALDWALRAQKLGNHNANVLLAGIYLKYPSLEKSPQIARQKAKAALLNGANSDHGYSQLMLGLWYLNEENNDIKNAKKWLKRACQNGDNDACELLKSNLKPK